MSADHILASYGNPPDAGATADILVQTTMMMFGSDPYFEQVITLMSLWNSVKDIAITNLLADYLSVTGFVDTWINAPHDDKNHVIYVDAAKRGAVALGNGNNFLEVCFAANEYTWPSHFDIALGNGNSEISVHPELSSRLAQLRAPPGWRFNSAPQLTTADITGGDGENVITLAEASGTIHVGGGTDTINILDGNSTVWLGSGFASVKVQSAGIEARGTEAFDTQVGTSDIYAGRVIATSASTTRSRADPTDDAAFHARRDRNGSPPRPTRCTLAMSRRFSNRSLVVTWRRSRWILPVTAPDRR